MNRFISGGLLLMILLSCSCSILKNHGSEKNVKENHPAVFPFQDYQNGKWGYMDIDGNIAIPPTFDYAGVYIEEYAVVANRSKFGLDYGYINIDGDIVIPMKYDCAFPVSDGLFCVLEKKDRSVSDGGETWLYFDNNKNKILELEYYRASPFSDGISVVSEYEGAKYGAIDIGGNYIIPPEYDSLGMFFDGYGRFWTDRKFGFINKNNEMIIPNIYELAKDYSEGCVPVKLNEKWGYVDENNKALIAFVFEDANSFSENVATVKENGLWGVIDHNGEYIISPQYPYLSRCFNGLIMVSDENNNFLYYINLNGEIIKPKL